MTPDAMRSGWFVARSVTNRFDWRYLLTDSLKAYE